MCVCCPCVCLFACLLACSRGVSDRVSVCLFVHLFALLETTVGPLAWPMRLLILFQGSTRCYLSSTQPKNRSHWWDILGWDIYRNREDDLHQIWLGFGKDVVGQILLDLAQDLVSQSVGVPPNEILHPGRDGMGGAALAPSAFYVVCEFCCLLSLRLLWSPQGS